MSFLLCFGFAVQAQNLTITGTVTSEEDPTGLPGVNVVVKGTTAGTVTDINGSYSLEVPSAESFLVFSSVGFVTQEITAGTNTVIDLIMVADVTSLEEIVVVGYGTQKRAKVTGAIAEVESEQLLKAPAANVSELLTGRAPGLITKQTSGVPGNDATSLSIRGFGTPLVLVDGVQMSFNRLDPNDIESVTVLKDASAAIYGARAGNGVILVTTKRGKIGKPSIAYHGNVSFQNPTVLPGRVNSWEYAELLREGELNFGLEETYTLEDIEKFKAQNDPNYPNEDWYDALYKEWVPMQQHNLSLNGGSDDVKYFVSAGFLDQASLFKSGDWNFNRYNVRSNLDANITKRLSLGLDVSYRYELRDEPLTDLSATYNDLGTAQPVWSATLPDPSKGGAYSGFSQRSPVATTTQSYSGSRYDTREYVNAQLSLKYEIIEGLFAKGQLSFLTTNEFRKNQNKPFDVFSYDYETEEYTWQGTNGANVLDERFQKYRQLYPLISLEYNKTVKDHTFKGLALAEWIDEFNRTTNTSRRDLLSMDIPYLFAGSPEDIQNNGSANERGRASYVARFNYDYKSKYLLEATFRADGSYNFAPDKRWGFFPSVSAGWRISDESFMNGLSWLDDLKLRGSYSQMGYDRYAPNGNLQEFRYLQGYTIREATTAYYMHGDELGRVITPTGLANPDVTWYDMTTYNIGLDGAFLEGIIGFELDVFYRLRENIFGEPLESYPSTFGAQLPVVNINTTDDRGFEFALNHKNRIGEVNFSVGAFVAYSREKWVKYNEDKYEDPDDIRIRQRTGNWTNRWIGYVSDGQFMTQEEINSHYIDQDQSGNTTLRPGDIRYVDVNGDSVITDRDRDVIGYGAVPDVTYGLDLNVEWKGFSVSALFQGASRFNMMISGRARAGFSNWSIPFDYHYQYRWTPDPNDQSQNINPDVRFPAVDGTGQGNTANNNLPSDFWLQDNTYLRLKNLNVSYSLPTELVQKAGIQNVRFYVAGTNLWTISKLGMYQDFWDPEGPQNQGGNQYPPLRTWTVGLNVTL